MHRCTVFIMFANMTAFALSQYNYVVGMNCLLVSQYNPITNHSASLSTRYYEEKSLSRKSSLCQLKSSENYLHQTEDDSYTPVNGHKQKSPILQCIPPIAKKFS